MKLYPIITKTLDKTATSQDFQQLWQSVELPKNSQCYGIYFNYTEQGYDFAIAIETPNQNMPIMIEDLTWYEKFSTKVELLGETWENINRKGKTRFIKTSFYG
ncbi:hypothetical protein ACWIW6_07840 [Ursidibacter sp. B-7004-1]